MCTIIIVDLVRTSNGVVEMLDRHDVIPLYSQLEGIIRNHIISGKYKDGDKIPSENQFMTEYSITRTTIRKAIENLVNQGLLEKIHGKGVFVRLREVKYNMWNFCGFSDYIKRRGEKPITKVISSDIIEVKGERYFKLVRARGVKKQDVEEYLTIDTSLLPISLFMDIHKIDFNNESLYNIMKSVYNINPKTAKLSIKAVEESILTKEYFGNDKVYLKACGEVLDESGNCIEKVNVIYNSKIEFNMVTDIG
ncbi:MAG: GntR family transcriptional regulator [Clostridium sp.]